MPDGLPPIGVIRRQNAFIRPPSPPDGNIHDRPESPPPPPPPPASSTARGKSRKSRKYRKMKTY
jgi:hypothetical protein